MNDVDNGRDYACVGQYVVRKYLYLLPNLAVKLKAALTKQS